MKRKSGVVATSQEPSSTSAPLVASTPSVSSVTSQEVPVSPGVSASQSESQCTPEPGDTPVPSNVSSDGSVVASMVIDPRPGARYPPAIWGWFRGVPLTKTDAQYLSSFGWGLADCRTGSVLTPSQAAKVEGLIARGVICWDSNVTVVPAP